MRIADRKSPIVSSALFSVGIHALLLVPIGLTGIKEMARTDVIRGVSSIELEFVASPHPSLSPFGGEDEGEGERQMAPAAQSVQPFDEGALSEQQPLAWKNPAPRYPWIARINGWEGTVLLRARVNLAGQAASVQVARSSGFSVLDGAAFEALKQWKFLPARKQNGQAVASQVEIPITFRLEQ
jgi:TonB family protein